MLSMFCCSGFSLSRLLLCFPVHNIHFHTPGQHTGVSKYKEESHVI